MQCYINNLLEPLERVETKGGYLNVFETLTNPSVSWSLKKKIYDMQIKVALEWLIKQDLKDFSRQSEQFQEEREEKQEGQKKRK